MNTELDVLVDIFWNHIRLGQWEFANATSILIKQLSAEQYENLLIAVTLQPEKHSSGSRSVSSSDLLTWLALQQIDKSLKTTSLTKSLSKEIEFNILTDHIKSIAPAPVLKELHSYHKDLVKNENKNPETGDADLKNFSVGCCNFLEKLIQDDPLLGICVIDMLLGSSGRIALNNISLLQMVFGQACALMKKTLDCDISDFRGHVMNLLQLLCICKSYLEWTDDSLHNLFNSVVNKTLDVAPDLMNCIWAAILDIENTYLLKPTCKLEETHILKEIVPNFEGKEDLVVYYAETCSQLLISENNEDHKKLFLLCCQKRLHLLCSILEGCLVLIERHEHKRVAQILSNPLLKPLSSLALLISWVKCSSFEEAESLLSNLIPNENDLSGMLGSACKKLIYQTKLIQWCMQKTRNILGVTFDGNLLLNVLFKQLEHSSVLHVLNETKLLKTLQYQEVVELLNKQTEIHKSYKEISFESVNTYLGFTIMKNFISLLIASKTGKILTQSNAIVELTSELLITLMSNLKKDLDNIEPISSKVEILENIFSLLFLRTSNFQDSVTEDIDFDNIEDSSRESSMSQSLDSNAEEVTDVVKTEMKKARRSLIFGDSVTEEKKLLSKDDINQALLQEIEGSSSDTLKPKEHSHELIHESHCTFLASTQLIKETLNLLGENLLAISAGRFSASKIITEDSNKPDSSLDYRISSLQAYTREGQWRLELVTGFEFTANRKNSGSKTNLKILSNDHVISRMLGSSENLVYLTLKKGDLTQAKQVVKMFDLKDNLSSHELDFIQKINQTSDRLKQIKKINQKKEQSYSNMDFVKSAASAGRLSSEVNQLTEKLLQHEFLQFTEFDTSVLSLAVSVDLMFSVTTTLHVAKCLCDLACLKVDGNSLVPYEANLMETTKSLKSVLSLVINKDLELFTLFGETIPEDFFTLSLAHRGRLSDESLQFHETKLSQSKYLFKVLSGTIDVLQSTIHELREPEDGDKPETKLKETSKELLALLDSEALSELNQISSTYDYLKTLFKYVNNLSGLQLYYQTKVGAVETDATDSVRPLKVANAFVVFNESISTIFGRLLFEWNLNPKKLDVWARQCGVNLMKVITENCGVIVSTVDEEETLVQLLLTKTPVTLNEHLDGSSTDGTLEAKKLSPSVVEELLNSVLDMIAEAGDNTPLTSSEICQILNMSARQLRYIDIRQLQTSIERQTFFINLFNLLFIHAIMLISSTKFDASLNITIPNLEDLLRSNSGRILFFKLICYDVCDIGIISAFDIYSYLLLGARKNGMLGIQEDKLWKDWHERFSAFSVQKFDPRILFMLSFGTLDCPRLQVLSVENIEVALKSATMEYLDNHIGIDEEKNEIFIPEMIKFHQELLLSHQDQQSTETTGEYFDLLRSLCSIASPVLKPKLELAIDAKYTVTFEPHNWKLRYQLPHKNSFHSFIPEEKKFSTDRVENTFSTLPKAISNYLKDSCPIGGTFIELCLIKNKIAKKTSTIFENNLLYSESDREDASLNILSSLQSGLADFTKICSQYFVLKNFVIESCSYFVNVFERVASFEHTLKEDCRKTLYNSLEKTLAHKFLLTLSPDKWSRLTPALIECCLKSRSCHKIDLELLVSLTPDLFDVIMSECIEEIKALLEMDSSNQPRDVLILELKKCLLLVRNSRRKVQHILNTFYLFPAKDVFDLLYICLEEKQGLSDKTVMLVEKKLKETKWCHKVYNMCMCSSTHDAFTCWQDVNATMEEHPEQIAWFLNDTKAFNLMHEWFDLYQLPDEIKEKCIQSKLEDVLINPSLTDLMVQNVLSRTPSKQMALKICQNVLANRKHYRTEFRFILHYVLDNLLDILEQHLHTKYVFNKIGIMCIELIPGEMRNTYKQLEEEPLLILEQLLMNLKVGIAGKVISCIQSELQRKYAACANSLLSQCDDMLGRYASLSLKMNTVQVQQSTQDIPVPLVLEEDEEDIRLHKGSMSTSGNRGERSLTFIPPAQSVHKEAWVKDEMVSSCMQCHNMFSMFNRRHHCRHCGRVVCATCSNYFCHITASQRKERACKPCYYYLESSKSNPSSPVRPVRTLSTDSRTFQVPSPVSMTADDEPEWTLSLDKISNKQLRDDFCFEQAPNASLCLSIVDLYSNSKASSGLLLKFCNDLSQCLQGEKQEVDAGVVAGMIEFILNHAKLKFMKSSDFSGVELCDTHLSRVEIIKILLESNWQDIPTMQEFAQPESLRRLRDKLMEKERFNLALEVTSKCGFDSTPVHFLMGISRLKCGDLEKAREHLSRCLTLTHGEAATAFGPNHHYLQCIVDVIEDTPLIALYQLDEGSAPLSTILHDQVKTAPSSSSGCTLDTRRYNELLYYLKSYGSHGHMIRFFVRNQLLSEAIAYIKEKKCSHDLFIAHVLQPCFQDGRYEEIYEKVKQTDPSMKFWEAYFKEACRYFSKHANYHCLYEVQLFVRDFFNAALSCVRFYLGTMGQPATSYTELNKRLPYLQKAAKHLDNLIKERSVRSSFVSQVGSSFLGEDKNQFSNQDIPTSKLKQHLSTVNLQIDVTNFLNSSKLSDGETSKQKNSSVPTLFGNGKERAELVVMILMYSVDEALPLASRIIQEFKLPSAPVFGRAVMRMAHAQKYQQVTNILQNIEKNGMISTNNKDEILLKVIKFIAQNGAMKDTTQYIKQVRGDVAKINAFISCGRLRDAYLEAVKKERVAEIQRILDEARAMNNQQNLIDICEKWLRHYHDNQTRKEMALNKSKVSK